MPDFDFPQWFNLGEAILWFVVAGVCIATPSVRRKLPAQRLWIGTLALVVFGISDLVEITSGAWWKPWWLFAMKASCVMVFAWLFIEARLRKKREQR